MKRIKLIVLTIMLLATVGLSKSIAQAPTILVNGTSTNYNLCIGVTYVLNPQIPTTCYMHDSNSSGGDFFISDNISTYTIVPFNVGNGRQFSQAYFTINGPGIYKIYCKYYYNSDPWDPFYTDTITFTAITSYLTSTAVFNSPCVNSGIDIIINSNGTVDGGFWTSSNNSVFDGGSFTFLEGTYNTYSTNSTPGSEYVICWVDFVEGCSRQYDSLLINSYDLPPSAPSGTISCIYGAPELCSGGDLNLSIDTITNAAGYIWTSSVWENILSPFYITVPYLDIVIGDYDQTNVVTVAAANGCGTSDSAVRSFHSYQEKDCTPPKIINVSNNLQKEYSIYPNPASSIVTVIFDHPEQTHKIFLLNLEGQVITNFVSKGISLEIDISKLPSGLYLLHSNSDTDEHYTKLSIIR
jgi:hypothetical protein